MALFPKLPQDASGIPVGGLWLPNGQWYALRATTATTTDNGGLPAAGLCVGRFASAVYTRASAAATISGNSGDFAVDSFVEFAVDVNISAISGTSPTIQFFLDRKGADAVYYQVYAGSVLNTVQAVSLSFGAGFSQAISLGATARLRWVITGSSPSVTFSASIYGK